MKLKKYLVFLFILMVVVIVYKVNENYLENKKTIIGTYYSKDYQPFDGRVVGISFDQENNCYLNFDGIQKTGTYNFNKDKNLLEIKLNDNKMNISYNLKDDYLVLPIINNGINLFKLYKISDIPIVSE